LANTDDVIQTSPQRTSGLMNRWTTVEFIRRHAFMHRLFHAYRENAEVDGRVAGTVVGAAAGAARPRVCVSDRGTDKLAHFHDAILEQEHVGLHPEVLWATLAIIVELGGSFCVVSNWLV
jgi:hypothetical protein